jgi:hypothetical protein
LPHNRAFGLAKVDLRVRRPSASQILPIPYSLSGFFIPTVVGNRADGSNASSGWFLLRDFWVNNGSEST